MGIPPLLGLGANFGMRKANFVVKIWHLEHKKKDFEVEKSLGRDFGRLGRIIRPHLRFGPNSRPKLVSNLAELHLPTGKYV
jgi:hypothetical protein